MRTRILLLAILLGVVLCFVSGAGYGDETLEETLFNNEPRLIDFYLLKAEVDYIKENPDSFLNVEFFYDRHGEWGLNVLPKNVDTKGKICIAVTDNRGMFSYKTGKFLLEQFERAIEDIRSSEITVWIIALNTEIVVVFRNKEETLGYFYEGEYHLWEE